MELNAIIAGVGGQGVLTIAQAISRVAMTHGHHVKQSEVHGMSQRGGAVQAHLRIAEHVIHSDLIPLGRADLLLAVEPLEALRYSEYLSDRASVVANSVPFANIPGYPSIDNVLERVARLGEHVILDARRLAGAAGSPKAENMVMLGAATLHMAYPLADFDALVETMFGHKGKRMVEINQRALRIGRRAAEVYREGLRRGRTSRDMCKWMDSLPTDRCAEMGVQGAYDAADSAPSAELSSEVEAAVRLLLAGARSRGRRQLFEHDVYRLVGLAGAIKPPIHSFIPSPATLSADMLADFPGDRVVLKIVSPDVVHKTEAGGVVFLPKSLEAVHEGMERLVRRHEQNGADVCGVLLVEYVEQATKGLGSELFVGIRRTREFGPVIAAGLGGVDTEFLAARMLPGVAVAKASAIDTTAEEFFDMFTQTAAYEMLAGKARGHDCIVGDGELIRCFRAFIGIARQFCEARSGDACVDELEINPFAFRKQEMVPLDGRGRLGDPIRIDPPRPLEAVDRLLEPRSIAVAGVSSRRNNFGRIILNNIKACGFPQDRLYVIKEDEVSIDGVPCVPRVDSLPERVDLLVAATAAQRAKELVQQSLPGPGEPGYCASMILIPGAMGEKEGTEGAHEAIHNAISQSRLRNPATPVFVGGNCLGIRSRPGSYDTFFIPASKLDPRRNAPPKRCALVSQSGAFLITRMSNLEFLDPCLAISIGNQVDLTVSDLVQSVAARNDVDCVGVYVEGFNDLDGLALLRAVERAVANGKVVVFYKAGRTTAGRDAAKGHTASVAGDYDVCQAALAAAGAIVCDTFKEFEQLLELATHLHDKTVGGNRIGAISNAGYEVVGMADTVKGTRYNLDMPALAEPSARRLQDVLAAQGLADLVNARNPLDLTPMATDQAYEDSIRVFLEAPEIDAVVVGCVPMTPALLTTPDEIVQAGSIAQRIPRLFAAATKPLVFVIDCRGPYTALACAIRESGVPLFRTADQAVRSLGRYLGHRNEWGVKSTAGPSDANSDDVNHLQDGVPALA